MSGFTLTEEQRRQEMMSVDNTVMIEGFVFTLHCGKPYMVMHKIPGERFGSIISCSKKTLEEHIHFINKNNVENLMTSMKDISFLPQCHSLKCVVISLARGCEKIDISPLYEMENLEAVNYNGMTQTGTGAAVVAVEATLDYSRIRGIKEISTYVESGNVTGFQLARNLEGLTLGGYEGKSLKEYFCSEKLKYITICDGKIKNLDGIQTSKVLSYIDIFDMPLLEDISALEYVADSVTALRISGCRRITDFSVLGKLKNLRHLELGGKKTRLPNLEFLNKLKNLQTFHFDMNVLDGNLTPCLQIPFVWCNKERPHYNMKNKALPKEEKYWEWGFGFLMYPEERL